MNIRKSDGTIDPSELIPPKTPQQVEFPINKKIDFSEVTITEGLSCNIDDAIAKLIGWLQEPTALVNILLDEHGVSEEQLIAMGSLIYPIEDHLLELLDRAKNNAYDVFENENSTDESKDKVIDAIDKINEQINRAKLFKYLIDEELSKGDLSELIVDKVESEKSGEVYIKIISLDRWAQKNHNTSLFQSAEGFTKNNARLVRSFGKEQKQSQIKDSITKDKPWLIEDKYYEKAPHEWYLAARYFARQLILADSKISRNHKKLAEKVLPDLTAAGFKPKGKKCYDASTIPKAFSKYKFI